MREIASRYCVGTSRKNEVISRYLKMKRNYLKVMRRFTWNLCSSNCMVMVAFSRNRRGAFVVFWVGYGNSGSAKLLGHALVSCFVCSWLNYVECVQWCEGGGMELKKRFATYRPRYLVPSAVSPMLNIQEETAGLLTSSEWRGIFFPSCGCWSSSVQAEFWK